MSNAEEPACASFFCTPMVWTRRTRAWQLQEEELVPKRRALKKPANPEQWSGKKKIKILAGGKILEVRALQGDECQEMARALRQSHHWLINKQLYFPEEDRTKTI